MTMISIRVPSRIKLSYLKDITNSTFTVVIGMKNDEDIFYKRNDCESIDDDG